MAKSVPKARNAVFTRVQTMATKKSVRIMNEVVYRLFQYVSCHHAAKKKAAGCLNIRLLSISNQIKINLSGLLVRMILNNIPESICRADTTAGLDFALERIDRVGRAEKPLAKIFQ